MGIGASVSSRAKHGPSRAAVKWQLAKAIEGDMEKEKDFDHQRNELEEKTSAEIKELKAKNEELIEKLLATEKELIIKRENLEKEQNRSLALMFSELPLSLLSDHTSTLSGNTTSLSKTISFVSIAWCDVVGFSSLVADLPPHDAVNLVDHIHALYDEAFSTKSIFIMERSSDSCVAVCGIDVADEEAERAPQRNETKTPISLADSSYETGDEAGDFNSHFAYGTGKSTATDLRRTAMLSKQPVTNASDDASILALATLDLMCMSTQIRIPGKPDYQLQMRIALHTGDCVGGIVGLQTSEASRQVPKYKLFGPTVKEVQNLCTSGLALQIRVSKPCRDLLHKRGGFQFERSPDQVSWHKDELVESYWLIGKDGLQLTMPVLDKALSLSAYDNL